MFVETFRQACNAASLTEASESQQRFVVDEERKEIVERKLLSLAKSLIDAGIELRPEYYSSRYSLWLDNQNVVVNDNEDIVYSSIELAEGIEITPEIENTIKRVVESTDNVFVTILVEDEEVNKDIIVGFKA